MKYPFTSVNSLQIPLIPVSILGRNGWKCVWMLVDFGGAYTLLHAAEAPRLGITNLHEGQRVDLVVADGGMIPAYLHVVRMRIGQAELDATAAFSNRLGSAFNILGRTDILDQMQVTLDLAHNRIIFKRR